jgi:hypothetical protein
MAHTGLALLAFQAGGHYHFNNNLYSNAVRKGLDWLVTHQRPDGGLIGSNSSGDRFHQQFMYEHGIAAFALGEACAVGGPDSHERGRYLESLHKAIQFIYRMQHSDGGWRYNDRLQEISDTSVTGWQVLALKTAKEAGIDLDPECVRKVRGFFDLRATGENGRTGYDNRNVATEATTGVGMLAKQFLLDEPEAPLVHDASSYLAGYAERTWPSHSAQGHDKDFYLWYNCTLAMFQAGGDNWKRWNSIVRDTIINLQRHDGCTRGSWDPNSRWGDRGGRIYSTALAALTLEVYYRYAGQHEQDIPGGPAAAPVVHSPTPAAKESVELNARSPAVQNPSNEPVLEPRGNEKGGVELNARQAPSKDGKAKRAKNR